MWHRGEANRRSVQKFLRCMLHNFAGNIEMYGILDAIASNPIEEHTSVNSTMVVISFIKCYLNKKLEHCTIKKEGEVNKFSHAKFTFEACLCTQFVG